MTLVAAPYSIEELGEDEERHEIGNFMDCEGFDVRGYHGEVLIEGTWHTVWQFGSMAEAERFARGWGGVLFDEATQANITERRAPEQVYQPD
jgi:hypothetical protein